MAKNVRTILGVACRDYLHERLLSACAVLGLVAALSPLLILYGVKYGLVQTLTERLLQDPRNLEITPVSSGKFTADYLARLQAHPDVIFVVPRTRSISATMTLRGASGDSRRELVASLEPSGPGDPLLARYAAAFSPMPSNLAAESIGITISATIAEKLGLAPNDRLWGRVERRYRGAAETARVSLHVAGILPLAAQQKDVIYAPLPLVQATEDYRDGRGVPELGEHNGWSGDPLPREERTYPGFRLHARSLEAVVALRAAFAAQNIEVYTRAEEIEQVTSLSRTLDLIFALICAATAAGFLASTASSVLAGIKRKERILGLLRLNGFTTGSLMLFPLTQTTLTSLAGFLLSGGVYTAAAAAINRMFRPDLADAEHICRLLPEHYLLALAAVLLLSLLAAIGPALRAARIEPSEVIREY